MEEEEKIVEFVQKTDNRKILQGLKNEALIFNGEKDLSMAAQRGEELHKLLENSELVINDGEYFDVFTQKDLGQVEQFLAVG